MPYNSGIFFITFTYHQWLPLIDKTNGYDVVYNWFDDLKSKGRFINTAILQQLISNIEIKRRENNKQHNVWKHSFDWKECRTPAFICQKLDYMHNNPCTGKWQLTNAPVNYQYSSAKFYLTGQQGLYTVANYMQMNGVDFRNSYMNTKGKNGGRFNPPVGT